MRRLRKMVKLDFCDCNTYINFHFHSVHPACSTRKLLAVLLDTEGNVSTILVSKMKCNSKSKLPVLYKLEVFTLKNLISQ